VPAPTPEDINKTVTPRKVETKPLVAVGKRVEVAGKVKVEVWRVVSMHPKATCPVR